MLAKAIFAVAAAVLVGLAAFAPPEAAAKGDRPVLSGNVGTSVAPIRIEAPRRIRSGLRIPTDILRLSAQ